MLITMLNDLSTSINVNKMIWIRYEFLVHWILFTDRNIRLGSEKTGTWFEWLAMCVTRLVFHFSSKNPRESWNCLLCYQWEMR